MKVYPLKTLGRILNTLRQDGKAIVQCHGCFDVLHIGHVRHFKEARNYGDILVVTVTSDKYVNKVGRPIFKQDDRADMAAALEYVDFVTVSDYPDASIPISILKPDYFAKGIDYADKGTSQVERDAVNKAGGMLVFTTTEKYSTTEIINRVKA